MTKPRITAAMLRKRPTPTPEAEPADEASAPQPDDAAHGHSHESTLDNPMFRAPQFGIRPKVSAQPAIYQQRAPRRRLGSEGS